MHRFNNILFVSHGLGNETKAMEQALKMTHDYQAQLSVLIICPSLPKNLSDYQENYYESMRQKVNDTIEAAKKNQRLSKKNWPANIYMESANTADIRIIQHALRYSIDLIIKEVESPKKTKGFKALDMELLRKCPCPLFLHRASEHKPEHIRVAVALDPQGEEEAMQALSHKLLELAGSVADHYNGHLSIISCWDSSMEHYLKGHAWLNVSEAEIKELADKENQTHKNYIESLIQEVGIKNELHSYRLKGKPDTLIPETIEENQIDILVMGTVGRTGISGFICSGLDLI